MASKESTDLWRARLRCCVRICSSGGQHGLGSSNTQTCWGWGGVDLAWQRVVVVCLLRTPRVLQWQCFPIDCAVAIARKRVYTWVAVRVWVRIDSQYTTKKPIHQRGRTWKT